MWQLELTDEDWTVIVHALQNYVEDMKNTEKGFEPLTEDALAINWGIDLIQSVLDKIELEEPPIEFTEEPNEN